ncbi:unnamed protein product [Hapterophycus canaliculatus]
MPGYFFSPTLRRQALVRDMSVARIAEKHAAEGKTPEYLPSVTASGGSGGGSSRATAVAQAVEEEVDIAILSHKESHPEKWAALAVSADPSDDTAAATAGGAKARGEAGGGGGGSGSGGAPAKGGGGGGAGAPPRLSTGGGGAPASAAAASNRRGSGEMKGRRSSRAAMGSKKTSAVSMAEAAEVTAVGDGGGGVTVMSKKEKTAMLVAQAREDAAVAAAEVTHDLNQTPAVLAGQEKPVLYSDPTLLLNRGWVEMEASLALVFGVEVLVCARWGPKVTFQSVLASSMMSEDGETEEQGPGFRGAFLHGIARIAPDVEEAKGE